MSNDGADPVSIDPKKVSAFISRCSSHTVRKGKDMAGCFSADPEPETVIYEIFESEPVGHISLAITDIKSGKVGDEYFMTKGHFHEDEEAGEVYFGLRGKGLLLLQKRDGETGEIELEPGTIACIPPGWAHRSVNTGKEDFVFLAAYPRDAGHDYASIDRGGFRKRVMDIEGRPTIVAKD
jgi:glucose-6-phosphate isomerase